MSLLQCCQKNIAGQAMYLDVHLNSCNALCCSCYLEVHIAKSIFHALDIGKDAKVAAIFNQAHSNACNRSFQRYACIKQGHGASADGSLGR